MKHALALVGFFFIATHILNPPAVTVPFAQDTVISGFATLQACEVAAGQLATVIPPDGAFDPVALWIVTPCMDQSNASPTLR